MNDAPPPYFEWALDRWKLLVLALLFLVLLLGALLWPEEAGATLRSLPLPIHLMSHSAEIVCRVA
ncbi:MAG: hypothetical protein R3C14_14645 [Caldilineaceae bacterium]